MADASIVIVTRNRKEVAAAAAASAFTQAGDPEVLVIDDASTDGTAEYLRSRFQGPGVVVVRRDRQEGYIVQRNRAAELASAPILISIDDDAVFTHPTIVQDTVRLFDEARVGAVAIPFVNHYDGADHVMLAEPADRDHAWVRSTFVGTAYAVRRKTFLDLGGFREQFFHWGEEAEFSQRLLAAGYVVRAGTSAPIRHFPGQVAGKYTRAVNRYISRNALLGIWLNAPKSLLLPLLAAQALRSLARGVMHPHAFPTALEGVALGLGSIRTQWSSRRPLDAGAYRLWLELRKRKITGLEEIRGRLPPPAFAAPVKPA